MTPSGIVVERFATAPELLTALQRWDVRWRPMPNEWAFRGHADAEWKLIPSAFRPDTKFSMNPGDQFAPSTLHGEQVLGEAILIRAFLRGINRQGLSGPTEASLRWLNFSALLGDLAKPDGYVEWPPHDIAPLFALAQHQGVPTRLLDWTERPLIAAYFAAVDAAARHRDGIGSGWMAIWALELTRAQIIIMGDLKTRRQPELQIVRPPRFSNANMRAQEGVFTVLVHRGLSRTAASGFPPLEELIDQRCRERPAEGKPEVPTVLRRLELPTAQAGALLRLLSYEFVSATDVFPGLEGVVRGMRERALWDAPTRE